jgi:hypothetical protein
VAAAMVASAALLLSGRSSLMDSFTFTCVCARARACSCLCVCAGFGMCNQWVGPTRLKDTAVRACLRTHAW